MISSQTPALIAIARAVSVGCALELGAGLVSTPLFLDRRVFPELDRLVSYENDQKWARTVHDCVGDDPRLTLRVVPGWIGPAVEAMQSLQGFDLVFIDDGHDFAERVATIRAVAKKVSHENMVALHDFEHNVYHDAVDGRWPYRFVFDAFEPHTALFWEKPKRVDVGLCDRLNIRVARAVAEATALETWLALAESVQ